MLDVNVARTIRLHGERDEQMAVPLHVRSTAAVLCDGFGHGADLIQFDRSH